MIARDKEICILKRETRQDLYSHHRLEFQISRCVQIERVCSINCVKFFCIDLKMGIKVQVEPEFTEA